MGGKSQWSPKARIAATALLAALGAFGVLGSARAACAIPENDSPTNMGALMQSSVDCLKTRQKDKASKLFYALSLRMRALARVDMAPGGTKLSVEQLQTQIGSVVNRYLGGDLGEWVAALDWALEWDASAPWPESDALFEKAGAGLDQKKQAVMKTREELSRMRLDISSMDKSLFYKKRASLGLEVREKIADKTSDARAGPER